MPQPISTGHVLIHPLPSQAERDADQQDRELRSQGLELNRMRLADAVEERNLKIAQQRAKQEQDTYLTDAIQRHSVDGKPDFDAVVQEAYTKYPDLAMTLEKQLGEHRSKIVDSRIKDAQLQKLNMDADTRLLEMSTDENLFKVFAPRMSEDLQKAFANGFNPQLRDQLLQHAPDEMNRLKLVSELIGKNPREALLHDLAGADSPEEWAATWDGYGQLGLKPQEIGAFQQMFGKDFSPEGLARVKEIAGAQKSGAAPNVGSLEDYVIRKYGPNPTPQQIEQARKTYNQSDDRPQGGAAPLSPAMESNILNRITTQWAAAKKPAEELNRQATLMKTGMEAARAGNMAQGSQAVLVTFQKILDPTSVVRESEYERSAAGQSLINRIRGAAERLTKGGTGVALPELEKFYALAQEAVKAQTGAYLKSTKDRIGRTADHYKIPRDLVFEDVDVVTGQGPAPAGAKKLTAEELIKKYSKGGD